MYRTSFLFVLTLLYFYNVSSYSAIQPQVCNKLSVQCSTSIIIIINCNENKSIQPLPNWPKTLKPQLTLTEIFFNILTHNMYPG